MHALFSRMLWMNARCFNNLAAAHYQMMHAVLKRRGEIFWIKKNIFSFLQKLYFKKLAQAHAQPCTLQPHACQACAPEQATQTLMNKCCELFFIH